MALWFTYKLACSFEGCSGKQALEQAVSAGLQLGDIVPEDPSDHRRGRCPRCQRCRMRVVEVPSAEPPAGPVGFTKIPTQ